MSFTYSYLFAKVKEKYMMKKKHDYDTFEILRATEEVRNNQFNLQIT